MPLKIIQPESVERFTALVIGAAGIGKTSLLRTIPSDEKVCVLSAEGGLLCVRDLVQSGHIEGFEIGTFTEFKEAFDFMAHDNQARERYRWIFIDSRTEIAGRCVEAYQAKYPDKKDSFNLWGGYRDSMTALIKGFRDLAPYNVVFTCLEEKDKDDINRIYYMPALAGKEVKERLTSYFDEVFYMATLESGGTVGNPSPTLSPSLAPIRALSRITSGDGKNGRESSRRTMGFPEPKPNARRLRLPRFIRGRHDDELP